MKKGEVQWYIIGLLLALIVLLFVYFAFIKPIYTTGTSIVGGLG